MSAHAPSTAPTTPTPAASTRLWVLGSGSKGNAAVVGHGDAHVMIDAGFELPELVARLRAAGLHPWLVDDVVLTHGHKDHVLGAADGARVYGWRTWGTLGTVWRWRALREIPLRPFDAGDAFAAGAFTVRTAGTPHDVDDSAAVVVEAPDGARVGYCTDLGEVPDAVAELLHGVDALVLEANHDDAMLRAGPYPPELQARVAGPTGHLANAQAAALARAVAHAGLRHLVLAHVSRHNNTPALAREAVRAALVGTPFRGTLHVAPQDAVLGPLTVSG